MTQIGTRVRYFRNINWWQEIFLEIMTDGEDKVLICYLAYFLEKNLENIFLGPCLVYVCLPLSIQILASLA